MTQLNYSKLKVLIADDFSNFRSTINGMLGKLGVNQVDVASNGDEVLRLCQKSRYDVILCDYDLGPGRNGQQVLEELRFRTLINKRSIFIIVSADATKDVVMAAYDCEPDDYLMKPITAQMLQQRMSRLLLQRRAMGNIYASVESGQLDRAIAQLVDMSISEGRYAIPAQKLLGELFIQNGDYSKAEKLYTKALQVRQLDWARLGLAKVKQLMGELDVAGDWLEKIVQENPLFLPAYDVLAENWKMQEEPVQTQITIQRSVDISPRSILRQKKLAATAEQNQDFNTALFALKAVVKLGELSCHSTPEDSFNLARVSAKSVENQVQPAQPLMMDAMDQLEKAREKFCLTDEQEARANMLEGHALLLQGDTQSGAEKIAQAAAQLERLNDVPLMTNLETLAALQSLGDDEKVESFVRTLLDRYADDQFALEQLDILLTEPVSESNQQMIATVNREGIDLYNACRFDDAIECFEKVLKIFPKHVGVHLNIVQSLIGKLKAGIRDEFTTLKTRESLSLIDSLVAPGHAQYARFERLRAMADGCLDEP